LFNLSKAVVEQPFYEGDKVRELFSKNREKFNFLLQNTIELGPSGSEF
jgi:hypothetical protein